MITILDLNIHVEQFGLTLQKRLNNKGLCFDNSALNN